MSERYYTQSARVKKHLPPMKSTDRKTKQFMAVRTKSSLRTRPTAFSWPRKANFRSWETYLNPCEDNLSYQTCSYCDAICADRTFPLNKSIVPDEKLLRIFCTPECELDYVSTIHPELWDQYVEYFAEKYPDVRIVLSPMIIRRTPKSNNELRKPIVLESPFRKKKRRKYTPRHRRNPHPIGMDIICQLKRS